MKKHFFITIIIALFATTVSTAAERNLVKYVNTLQGTNSDFGLSYGNTFPATAMPFGMHEWSPQTGKNGDGWKYTYQSKSIRGFIQSHQCSPWVGDYAAFSLMPETGKLIVDEDARSAVFTHANETAQPHYYSVKFNNGIQTELAPTERGVHFRFTFPSRNDAYIVLDGYTAQSNIQIDAANHCITGWINNQRFVNHSQNFRSYFVIEFDRPFTDYGTWENKSNVVFARSISGNGLGYGAYVKFKPGTKVQAKIASSYISLDQAKLNLRQELGKNRSFDDTKRQGYEVWNKLLNRVLVEGGTEEQLRTFYSCLFRANLFSRKFYEISPDGSPYYYSPYDGNVHQGYMFTDNGFWDTFRSQFPLTNILHPTQQGHYMQALLAAQKQCGWLPSWSFPGETGGMVGNHAISLLADAWAKGIRTVSADSILKAYAHEAFNKGPYGGANGRQGWQYYFTLGFVPFPESQGSVTQTLEYAYDDFCAYNLARMSGNHYYEQIFARHMYNYRNLWDKNTQFMRGRGVDGSFTPNFDAFAWGGPYTEGNAWHYVWSVFHDVQGLINLFGSDKAFIAKMDSVFTLPNTVHTGWYGGMIHEMKEMQLANMGQYAHGNQPIQHMPYLYSYAGQPWKTQYWVRQIMSRLYNSTENGFPGDEDQGGMSSWYVLSALGIYAVTPGTNQYVLGSPLFRKVSITMENGRKFVIEAPENNPDNVYIQSATLNGNPLDKNFITYDDIQNGAHMMLHMSNHPNTTRNTDKQAAPFSLSNPQ